MSALRFTPPLAAWFDAAIAAQRAGQADAAAALCGKILAKDPAHRDALHLRGVLAFQAQDYPAARAWYAQAAKIDADQPQLLCNRGRLELTEQNFQVAEACYARARALAPTSAIAARGHGEALIHLARAPEALAAYDAALAHEPDALAARLGKAHVLGVLGRFDEMAAVCASIPPDHPRAAEADILRGRALCGQGQYDAADALLWPLFLAGKRGLLPALLMSLRQFACDWRDRDRLRAALSPDQHAMFGTMDIAVAALDADAAMQAAWARQAAAKIPSAPAALPRHRSSDRIRIGYLSANFQEHAVAYVVAELFELHRRDRFVVIGLSLGPADDSAMRQRLRAGFDQFIDLHGQPDGDIAATIAGLEIDILVDLMGYTDGGRPALLARRPAPIQVSYIGYPGTLGAEWMDYIIADRIVIPAEDFPHYAEQVVWMPACYQVNDRKRAIGPTPDRASQGLPAHGFVFACLNHTFKIQPEIFAVWMRLLHAVPGSVLWLVDDNTTTTRNLRRQASASGIDPARLVFAARLPLDAHLGRLRLADLFLDTVPYNAHATGSDALWAGLPVLTCRGAAFPGRVGASLLAAVGLGALVAENLADYEAMARRLVNEPALLAAARRRLADNRDHCALFDTPRFCAGLEAAYEIMWARYCAGQPPAPIKVPESAQ